MVMDVHERYRTETYSSRFNERLLLSLASCKACLFMDDELNILPISSHMKLTTVSSIIEDQESLPGAEQDLLSLKEQLLDVFPDGPLVGMSATFDQGKSVFTFLDAILDKKVQSTTALTAAHGRGKSAALGLGIAGAIAAGYSNIFVTAPTLENLKSLFEFVCRGLQALEYKEHIHYECGSSYPKCGEAVTHINIFKNRSQRVQGRMKIEKQQILSLFRKVMTKIYKYFYDVLTKDFERSLPRERMVSLTPHSISVDDDLEDGAKQIMEKMKTENVGQLNPELLQQYSIADREAGFEQALRSCSTISSSGLISVKSNRDKAVKNNKTADSKNRKRKGYMQTSSKRHPSK